MTEELTKQEKMRLYQKKWRQENAEKRSEYGIKYYANNKDKFVAYQIANKEHIQERCKAYYQKKKLEKLNLKINE
jgi:hypothetical protein